MKDYLLKLGFEPDDIDYILTYASSESDSKALQEKIDYLINLGLSIRQIRIIFEEDITFVTESLEHIKDNIETLEKYLSNDEIIDTLEITPELLNLEKGRIERNINLLKMLIPEDEILKVIIQDKGEILTYKTDYLSDKLSFLVKNGLKDNILKIILENIEIFEQDNSEINLEELKI